MALQSDTRGFLVGEPIEIGRMPNDISRIRDDVSAIRRAIAERGRSFSGSERTNFATPERGANGRFVSKSTPAIATPSGSRKLDPVQAAIAEGARNAVAERIRRVSNSSGSALPGRDSAGRFAAGGINSGSANSAIASIGDRLARLTGVASGIEDADPAVKAAREIAEPMQRTFEFFRGDKQTSWLKKIFSRLSIFHKEESVYNRATKETLEKIERKPVAAGAQSGLMSAISSLPVIGSIARAIGITTVGGGMLGTLAKGGRGMFGLLKRVPVLGSLLAAGGAAFDIFDSENSGLSRRDKDKAAGTSIGGWAGSLGGVAAGAVAGSLLGPVGTIVGGIVGGFLGDQAGQIIGDRFGGWVSDLREADIPGKIASAWDSAVTAMSMTFNEAWAKVKDIGSLVANVVGEQLDGLNNYVKANTGIDFKQKGTAWVERTKQAASSLVDQAMQGMDWVSKNSTVGKALGKVVDAFQGGSIPGLSDAEAAALAADTRRTESGGNYRSENKYGYVGGYQFGASALADTGLIDPAKLKAAQKSGRFNQKEFLADSSNWLLAGGKNAFLADQALQDQTYSKYSAQLQKAGIRSGALSPESTPEQIAAYVKAAHLVGAGGANAYFNRGIDRADANGTLASRYAKQGALAVASASRVQATLKPLSMPPFAESPSVIEPLSSPKNPEFTVNIPSQDVGQRLSDRTTAYIASGGIHK